MKRIYKKEEGVSPVIATILMVAITVVLAATVWLMVSGYMGGGTPALQGTLQYDYQSSNLAAGYVNFTLLLSQPTGGITPSDVNMQINGTTLTYSTTSPPADNYWSFIDNDGNGKLSNGDIIIIHYSSANHGNVVSFGAKGYSGSVSATIP